MIKVIVTSVMVAVVLASAAFITAQEQEPSGDAAVKAIASRGRSDLLKSVKEADASYFKRIGPSEKRAGIGRCRSIIATCTKTIAALERVAASAKKDGADVESVLAEEKIAIVKEYLAKAQADMPKTKAAPKSIRLVNLRAARRKLGGHYYLGVLKKVTWDEANRMAKAYGGYLATIDSSKEMVSLGKLTCTNTWIGGVPGREPAQWQWQDGKKIADILWSGKKPDVKSDRRVHISSRGLGTHTTKGTLDAFIIEWNR
jgi:hypothetical protein